MSKNNNNSLSDQLAGIIATSPGGPNPGNGSATEELAQLMRRKFLKEEIEETDRAAEQQRYREQQMENIERAMRMRDNMQAGCGHLKPNYTSALNGQRDHNGELHEVCSYCAREFTEQELRSPQYRHLNLPSERVGGPIQ